MAYRPHEGQGGALLSLVDQHVPSLRKLGLVTDREPVIMQAQDGTVLEVFEWASAEAIAAAHESPEVQALWAQFATVCDYQPAGEVTEMSSLFSEFAPCN